MLFRLLIIISFIGVTATSYSQEFSREMLYNLDLSDIASRKSNFNQELLTIDQQLRSSKNPIVAYNTGVEQFEAGNGVESEYFFNQAIKYDPYFAEAYLFIGRIRIQQKKYPEAIMFGKEAVKYNPELVAAHLDLFLSYSRTKEKELAQDHLSKAAKLDPESVSRTASRLITEKDDLYGALFFFEKIHSVAPANILNSLNYAKALMISGRDLRAEKVLEIAYQANDFYHENFQLLYSMYFSKLMQHGKHEFILTMASEKVPSTFVSQYLYKSLSHFKLGNTKEFEENARIYFSYTEDVMPASLADWAKSQLAISFNQSPSTPKKGNQYRG